MNTPIVPFLALLTLLSGSCTSKSGGVDGPGPAQTGADAKAPAPKVPALPKGMQRYEGYLEIDPFRYGKAVQAATVHTTDGKRIGIEMRYTAEHLKFVNKRVVVVGGMARSSSDPRAQAYTYFKVHALTLAPGEKPWPTPPTAVPAPPVVHSKAEIDKLPGAWGVAVGTVTYQVDPKSVRPDALTHVIEKAVLTLSDGFKLEKHLWHMTGVDSPDYVNGSTATMVFKYSPSWKDHPFSIMKFCHGEFPRCGQVKQPAILTLGHLVSGDYAVKERTKDLGRLRLISGKTLFVPAPKAAPSATVKKRFPFFTKHRGTYTVAWLRGIVPGHDVNTMAKNQMLARITLDGTHTFLLRMGQKGDTLEFHSTKGELQTWSVSRAFGRLPMITRKNH